MAYAEGLHYAMLYAIHAVEKATRHDILCACLSGDTKAIRRLQVVRLMELDLESKNLV
jgi:hypothetical protein